MVTSSNLIQPENVPLTERVTHYHALRVYLQVAQWKNLSLACLDLKEWGWKEKNGALEPVKTDIDPAPAWLLQVIKCNCKTDSRHPCGTRLCPCRKIGLSCVAVCGGCHREGCENSIKDEREIEGNQSENGRNIFEILQTFD